MERMIRRERRALLDQRCVFCFSNPGTTDEHIIPRSIGGELIIKNGTCGQCLKLIQLYEGKLLDANFSAAQTLLGIKTNTGKVRRGFKGPKWADDFRSARTEYIRPQDHSGVITLVNFDSPGIEVGRPPRNGFGGISIDMKQIAPGTDVPSLSTSGLGDEAIWAPFIAKMAHAYWVFKEGHSSLHFMLQSLVLQREMTWAEHMIGKCKEILPQDDLHYIAHRTVQIGGDLWGRVDIALFSCFGHPSMQTRYSVYLGKLARGPYILQQPFLNSGM